MMIDEVKITILKDSDRVYIKFDKVRDKIPETILNIGNLDDASIGSNNTPQAEPK